MKITFILSIILLILGLFNLGAAATEAPQLSKAVFYVQWYNVGQSALEELKGVKEVKNGFRGFREINTVLYDASMVTLEEMVAALKKAGTYLGTADE